MDRTFAFKIRMYLPDIYYKQPPSKPDKQVSKHPACHNLSSFEH
ncbi:MAG: hypothetical protein Q8851_02245 [Sweet potato little leaf phytoplasma]|nr:hypothetical protein [Sweet potato little leaf phytoplasma]